MGTGYSRQSAADIITDANITAAPLNAEFNAIQSAFDSTAGHSHDGTSGEGPQINLTTSITGTLPIANGGTNATTAAGARTSLGLVIGTDVQAYDDGLASIAGLTTAANKLIYTTALDTYAVADLSGFGRSLIDDADAAAARTTLGLVIGTDVQAYSADLSAIAALAKTDGNIIVSDGTTWVAESGATARATLGLVIGTDVQAYSSVLAGTTASFTTALKSNYDTAYGWGDHAAAGYITTVGSTLGAISALAVTDGNFIVGNGTTWVAESGATARTSLGLGSLATANSINNGDWSGTDLAVVNGGTGASDAATARSNLGLVIGTDVQAYSADLSAITALAKTDGNFIVGDGSTWVAESGATARASMGVYSTAEVDAAIAATSGPIKAWVNFNGTGTVSIRASSNVSSITDLGVGNYVVNFSSALSDADYVVSATAETYTATLPLAGTQTTTQCQLYSLNPNVSLADTARMHVVFVR
jgi:hypothetical protein